jgi:hypothetical protein
MVNREIHEIRERDSRDKKDLTVGHHEDEEYGGQRLNRAERGDWQEWESGGEPTAVQTLREVSYRMFRPSFGLAGGRM